MVVRALGSVLLVAASAVASAEELWENSLFGNPVVDENSEGSLSENPAVPKNSERCCEECVAPKVKYYSVDAEHGHCGECCLYPHMYPVIKLFEKNLTKANGDSCTKNGYGKYDKTETHGMAPIEVTLDLYDLGAPSAKPIKLHRIVHGECGQLTLPRTVAAASAIAMMGLLEGACADEGYTESVGVQSADMPILGMATAELFREPNFLGLAVDLLQKVGGDGEPKGPGPCCAECKALEKKYISVSSSGGACSESCLGWMAHVAAQTFDPNLELADGRSCAALGFPMYDGTSVLGAPPASTPMDLYKPTPQEGAPGAMHKIVDGLCGQASVTEDAVATAERMGLVPGSCAAAGYTEAVTGTSAGPFEVKLYRKFGEPSFLAGLAKQFNPLAAASMLMV